MAKQSKDKALSVTHKAEQETEHEIVVTAIKTDEHAGKSGSYLFDPLTKKRILIDDAQAVQTAVITQET